MFNNMTVLRNGTRKELKAWKPRFHHERDDIRSGKTFWMESAENGKPSYCSRFCDCRPISTCGRKGNRSIKYCFCTGMGVNKGWRHYWSSWNTMNIEYSLVAVQDSWNISVINNQEPFEWFRNVYKVNMKNDVRSIIIKSWIFWIMIIETTSLCSLSLFFLLL